MSHMVSVSIRSAPLAAVSAAYDTAAGSMGTHACGSMHGPPDESAESGNAVGAYDSLMRDCPLPTPEDRLFFILTYLKTYALQVVQGRLFGMVQGKANQWSHVLLPALLAALRTLGDAPTRSLTTLAQRLGVAEADAAMAITPLAEERAPVASAPVATPVSPPFAHDGTKRRIVRPQDPAEQTDCYSGKKKDHTVKNVLLVNAPLTILFLSETSGGRVHDKRIADATPYPLPAGRRLLQALGFLACTLPQ